MHKKFVKLKKGFLVNYNVGSNDLLHYEGSVYDDAGVNIQCFSDAGDSDTDGARVWSNICYLVSTDTALWEIILNIS